MSGATTFNWLQLAFDSFCGCQKYFHWLQFSGVWLCFGWHWFALLVWYSYNLNWIKVSRWLVMQSTEAEKMTHSNSNSCNSVVRQLFAITVTSKGRHSLFFSFSRKKSTIFQQRKKRWSLHFEVWSRFSGHQLNVGLQEVHKIGTTVFDFIALNI